MEGVNGVDASKRPAGYGRVAGPYGWYLLQEGKLNCKEVEDYKKTSSCT